MSFQLVHFSNSGGYRPTNQDGYCIRISTTSVGIVSMLAVCDGMGGMSSGEVASSTVIHALGEWFDQFSSSLTPECLAPQIISQELHRIVSEKHQVLQRYGKNCGQHLGTTLSVILLTRMQYYLLHVGDSRIYLTDPWKTSQLTHDQTLAMRELEAKRITESEYQQDYRRNILLQCVGDQSVNPVFIVGESPVEGGVLLCTDGFYHTVKRKEIHAAMRQPGGKITIQQCLLSLANRARTQGETDNITCIALRWTKNAMRMQRQSNHGTTESLANISFINGTPL